MVIPVHRLGRYFPGVGRRIAIEGSEIENRAAGFFDRPTASVTVENTDASPKMLLAADPVNDRLIIVAAFGVEASIDKPEFNVGPTSAPDAIFDNLGGGVWLAGDRLLGFGVLPAGDDLLCTIVAPATKGKVTFEVVAVTVDVNGAQLDDWSVNGIKLADAGVNFLDGNVSTDVNVTDFGASPVTLLAADVTVDRLVVVQAIGYENASPAAGPIPPDWDVGPTATPNACFDNFAGGTWMEGDRYLGFCIVPQNEDLLVTMNEAAQAGTGGVLFGVIAVTPLVHPIQLDTPTAIVAVDHSDGSPAVLLGADANNSRLVVVEAIGVAFASGAPKPEFDVGPASDPDGLFDDLGAGAWKVGDRYLGACIIPPGQQLRCTINVVGTSGGFSFRIVAMTLLSADAPGRLLMSDDYFDETTVDLKFVAGAVDGADIIKAASIGDDRLASFFLKEPGVLASALLRLSGDYVAPTDTFTIGTDVFVIDNLVWASGDVTAGGSWNNITNPLTVAMPIATYPVLSPASATPLTVGELIYVDDLAGNHEYMRVTAIVGNNVTFRRGAGGCPIVAIGNAALILTGATRPPIGIQVGVQATFTRAVVTPIFAATINEPAGSPGQADRVVAASLTNLAAGDTLLIVAKTTGVLGLATTQVSAMGLWDTAAMQRGENAATRQVFRASIIPNAAEVSAGFLLVPVPFTPTIVLVRILDTLGMNYEIAAAAAVQEWDGPTVILPAVPPVPAYISLGVGTTVQWDGSQSLEILAIE